MPKDRLKKIILYTALSLPLYTSSMSTAQATEYASAMGNNDVSNVKTIKSEAIIHKKRPCSTFLEDKIVEVTNADIERNLESFTDYEDGEPTIHILSRFFQDATRKNSEGMCYFVKGKTIQNSLTHRYTGSRRDVKNGVVKKFTYLPLDSMDYLQAEITDGRVEIKGSYSRGVNDGVLTIPEKFHLTMKIDKVEPKKNKNEKDNQARYHVEFIQNNNLPKVKIWMWVRWILGVDLEGMDVCRTDSSSNRKEIYDLIRSLDEHNKIKIGKK